MDTNTAPALPVGMLRAVVRGPVYCQPNSISRSPDLGDLRTLETQGLVLHLGNGMWVATDAGAALAAATKPAW